MAASLTAALREYTDLGSPHGQADTLNALGVLQRITGDPAAGDSFTQALGIYRHLGVLQGEAEVLNHWGTLLRTADDGKSALAMYKSALKSARNIKLPLEEAHALRGMGQCLANTGDIISALDHMRDAQKVYQRLGLPEVAEIESVVSQQLTA